MLVRTSKLIIIALTSIVAFGCPTAQNESDLPEPLEVGGIQGFDVDGDGQRDFLFSSLTHGNSVGGKGTSFLSVHGEARPLSAEVLDYSREFKPMFAYPLSHGELITETARSSSWESSGRLAQGDASANVWSGPFVGDRPRFLGIRLLREGGYYYGWILFKADTTDAGRHPLNEDSTAFIVHNPTFLLYDHALQTVAGKSIKAGEKP